MEHPAREVVPGPPFVLVPGPVEPQHGPVDLAGRGRRVGEDRESIQVAASFFEDGARFLPGLFGLTRVEIKRGKLYTYVGVIGIERRGALKVVEGGPELTGVVERDGEALGGDGIVFIELYDFQKLDDRCLSLALRQIFFPAF